MLSMETSWTAAEIARLAPGPAGTSSRSFAGERLPARPTHHSRRIDRSRAFLDTMQDAIQGAESCSVHLSWTEQGDRRATQRGQLRRSLSFSTEHWEQLGRVLACSDATLRQVVQRWPGISAVSVPEVMQRMLSLKTLLPRCNVAAMVTLQPALFLARTPEQIEAQVGGAHAILSHDLPTTYVDQMIQERPAILFIDIGCLPHAVAQLKDMIAHPTDPASLSNVLWAVKQDAADALAQPDAAFTTARMRSHGI